MAGQHDVAPRELAIKEMVLGIRTNDHYRLRYDERLGVVALLQKNNFYLTVKIVQRLRFQAAP